MLTAVVATTWLLEPAGLATFPLVMVCLGVAMSGTRPDGATEPADRPTFSLQARRLLLLVGFVLGSLYLLTDMRLDAAMRHNAGAVASRTTWAPWDPVAANTAAAAYANFDGSEPALRDALGWMEKAGARPPT